MNSWVVFLCLNWQYYFLFQVCVYSVFVLNLQFNTASLVNQTILKSIRVSCVKEDIFGSLIRLWVIIILLIPFHVINIVIPYPVTFVIFCCYQIAPGEISIIFMLAHLQVVSEHLVTGYYIKTTNYAEPKILIRIFKDVGLDFRTLITTYMGT